MIRAVTLPAGLLLVLVALARAEPESRAAFLLPGGVRVAGAPVAGPGPFVRVAVGRFVYELEPENIVREGSGTSAPASEEVSRLVEDLVPRLASTDPDVARAARAALLVLGTRAIEDLDAARREAGAGPLGDALDEVRSEIRATGATARGPAPTVPSRPVPKGTSPGAGR